MANTVNINPDRLIEAADTVADHLAAAALPPPGALPPGLAPSPADLAASGVDGILQAKITSSSTGLIEQGRKLNDLTGSASAILTKQDRDNANRITQVQDRDIGPQPVQRK